MKAKLIFCILWSTGTVVFAQKDPVQEFKRTFNGPLKVSDINSCFFTDNSGKSIFLTGSHTWANFQDYGEKGTAPFNYSEYISFMQKYNHNFMRLWTWEQFQQAPWTSDKIFFSPLPWLRTGIEKANDQLPQFDLEKWNEDYFTRLRKRVIDAGSKGIYVSVMLFQGFSLNKGSEKDGDPWIFHPLNPANNVQSVGPIDSVPDNDTKATMHSLKNPEVLKYQEKYVLKVLQTLNDLDNVLYEIINEGGTTEWTYYFINFIHENEKKMAIQHMVGMTDRIDPDQSNQLLIDSPADWISPSSEPQDWMYKGSVFLINYRDNPPVNQTGKVIIADTDHIWGTGGNYKWAWKCFVRGLNAIFMDPYLPLTDDHNEKPWDYIGGICKDTQDFPDYEPLRLNMGYILNLSKRLDLVHMVPHNELSSTNYCLANPGKEYFIYFPEGGTAILDLKISNSKYIMEWFFPLLNKTFTRNDFVNGGDYLTITSPFSGDAVLYLKKKE